MKTKQIFITQELALKIQLKDFQLQGAQIIPKHSSVFFNKHINKQQEIHIYDLGFNTNTTIIPINNHINKTGINPLREHKTTNTQFYDITEIYQEQKQGEIAECFGNKTPKKNNNKYRQTRFLCNYAIAAYCAGFKTIFAYIID